MLAAAYPAVGALYPEAFGRPRLGRQPGLPAGFERRGLLGVPRGTPLEVFGAESLGVEEQVLRPEPVGCEVLSQRGVHVRRQVYLPVLDALGVVLALHDVADSGGCLAGPHHDGLHP